MRHAYILIAYLLSPLLLVNWLLRGWRERGYWAHLPERYGFGPPLPGPHLWVHAVSAGEVQAGAPLVAALQAARPDLRLLVTTATPAGRARAFALYPQATVRYLPIDLPGSVRRFYDRVRPSVAVVLETELWPTLYAGAAARGIPRVLASARLSPRSVRRYSRVAPFLREVLSGVTIAAQTAEDAARFIEIGAEAALVSVSGNLKFDYTPHAEVATRARLWRVALGDDRPVWVAGSTHAGEEELVLAAHRQLLTRYPRALLVLVPRHPPRFTAVEAALKAGGWACAVRDRRGDLPPTVNCSVLLLATLGELECAYAAADVAFVGGTLVPVGGHNLLEPAALGRPVLFGPSYATARVMAELLVGAGGAVLVADGAALAAQLKAYFDSPQARLIAGQAAAAAVAQNRGAAARIAALVMAHLR